MNYTKGEWIVEHYPNSQIKVQCGVDSICILTYDGKAADKVEANAHLIAAGPDMYEALRELHKVFFSSPAYYSTEQNAALSKALLALEKAEGKS